MSDQQDIWTSIREKLDWEEVDYLNSVMDKQNNALEETGRNLEELQRLLGQLKESTLDVATDQFSQEIEAHEREETEQHNAMVMEEVHRLMAIGAAGSPTPSMYDPDGELERVEVKIIAGDGDQVAYTNDSVKRFIEKRLALAWTALKNADHLNDLAAPNLLTNQDPTDAAMDIIGKCTEEISALNVATINGDVAII